MPRGAIRQTPLKKDEQFIFVNDEKLRLSLATLADRYSDAIRDKIYRSYNDPVLLNMYKNIRNSGIYQKKGKSGTYRKVFEIPDRDIYDFIDTILTNLYGPHWINDNKAIKHELVRVWWVIDRL